MIWGFATEAGLQAQGPDVMFRDANEIAPFAQAEISEARQA